MARLPDLRALHLYLPDGATGFACRVCHIDKRLSMPRLRTDRSVDLSGAGSSAKADEEGLFRPGPSYARGAGSAG